MNSAELTSGKLETGELFERILAWFELFLKI